MLRAPAQAQRCALSRRYNDPRPSLTRPIWGALLFPFVQHAWLGRLPWLFLWGTLHWQRERLVARAHCGGRAFVARSRVCAAQHTGQKLKLRGASRKRVSQPSAFAGRDNGVPRPVIALRGESRLPPPLPGCKTSDHRGLGRCLSCRRTGRRGRGKSAHLGCSRSP